MTSYMMNYMTELNAGPTVVGLAVLASAQLAQIFSEDNISRSD